MNIYSKLTYLLFVIIVLLGISTNYIYIKYISLLIIWSETIESLMVVIKELKFIYKIKKRKKNELQKHS